MPRLLPTAAEIRQVLAGEPGLNWPVIALFGSCMGTSHLLRKSCQNCCGPTIGTSLCHFFTEAHTAQKAVKRNAKPTNPTTDSEASRSREGPPSSKIYKIA